mmetsp:Transcript_15810/g.29746  ORF Transcript_15810/g.29746 Transcript_15810/m.29746 type:complete len:171 (+) Transcript_15810:36-548(+)
MVETRERCSELQAALKAGKEPVDVNSATLSAESELQRLQLLLREEHLRCETLAASRDHFRRKVEELCQRILQDVPGSHQQLALASLSPVKSVSQAPTMEVREGPCQGRQCQNFSLEWLQQQKTELLASGLYTNEDAVIRALDAQMDEVLGAPAPFPVSLHSQEKSLVDTA